MGGACAGAVSLLPPAPQRGSDGSCSARASATALPGEVHDPGADGSIRLGPQLPAAVEEPQVEAERPDGVAEAEHLVEGVAETSGQHPEDLAGTGGRLLQLFWCFLP